jgi:hypothetical protein
MILFNNPISLRLNLILCSRLLLSVPLDHLLNISQSELRCFSSMLTQSQPSLFNRLKNTNWNMEYLKLKFIC